MKGEDAFGESIELESAVGREGEGLAVVDALGEEVDAHVRRDGRAVAELDLAAERVGWDGDDIANVDFLPVEISWSERIHGGAEIPDAAGGNDGYGELAVLVGADKDFLEDGSGVSAVGDQGVADGELYVVGETDADDLARVGRGGSLFEFGERGCWRGPLCR